MKAKKTVKKKTAKKNIKKKGYRHQLLFISSADDYDSMYSQIADINDILTAGWKVVQISSCGLHSAIIVIEKDG